MAASSQTGGSSGATCTFNAPASGASGWQTLYAHFNTQPCCMKNSGLASTSYYLFGTSQGELDGHVRDSSGGPLANVHVTVVGQPGNFEGVTDGAGFYTVLVPFGTYKASAGASFTPTSADVDIRGDTHQDFNAAGGGTPPGGGPPAGGGPPGGGGLPGGGGPPGGAPSAGGKRPTVTEVRCDYITATLADTCTTTVRDPNRSPSSPTGTVAFTSTGGGRFAGTSCVLAAIGSSRDRASCSVAYIPPATGQPTVAATYSGDGAHVGSSGTTKSLLPGNVARAVTTLGVQPGSFPGAPSGPATVSRAFGTTVTYTLGAPARVRFTVQRRTTGRRDARGRCVAGRTGNRKNMRCIRFVAVRGSFSRTGGKGKHAFRFRGRVGGKRLGPGRYRLVATPFIAGVKGKPTMKRFRVVP